MFPNSWLHCIVRLLGMAPHSQAPWGGEVATGRHGYSPIGHLQTDLVGTGGGADHSGAHSGTGAYTLRTYRIY